MPTPIDGKVGPSVTLSLLNILFPVADNHSLVNQVKNYMKKKGNSMIGKNLIL